MSWWAESLVAWLRVTAGLAVLLCGLPALAMPRRPGQSPLDSFWERLLAAMLFWILAVYVLAALGDFELLTLAPVTALALIGAWRWRRRSRPDPAAGFPSGPAEVGAEPATTPAPIGPIPLAGVLLEMLDRGFWRRAGEAIGRRRSAWVQWALALGRRLADPATLAGVIGIVGGFALRLWGPLRQVSPGAADTYTHLLWTNLLLHSQVFPQGVYPEGMHAIAAVVAAAFFVPPLNVLRFLGPTDGFLLILAVYTLALELSGNRLGAAVAALVFGLGTGSPLPEAAWRQINPLPQELGAVFVPLALAFAVRYLRGGGRRALLATAAALAVGALIHPNAPMYAGIVLTCLAGAYAVQAGPGRRRALPLLGASAAASLFGLLPLIAGRLAGIPFYASSVQLVQRSHTAAGVPPGGLVAFLGGNPYLLAGLVFAVGAWVVSAGVGTLAAQKPLLRGFGLALVVMIGLMALALTDTPLIPDVARTTEFFSIIFIPTAAGLIFGGGLAAPSRRRTALALASVLVLPSLILWPPVAPHPQRFEPQGASRAFLDIRNTFTVRQWTIVAPVQQFSEAVGHGWHVELSAFVLRFSPSEAADPGFLLANAGNGAITTPDIFVYVETVPLGATVPVDAADLLLPLPVSGNANYLYTGSRLVAIEARAYIWCMTYLHSHPATTSIYYRNAAFTVFHIHQP